MENSIEMGMVRDFAKAEGLDLDKHIQGALAVMFILLAREAAAWKMDRKAQLLFVRTLSDMLFGLGEAIAMDEDDG